MSFAVGRGPDRWPIERELEPFGDSNAHPTAVAAKVFPVQSRVRALPLLDEAFDHLRTTVMAFVKDILTHHGQRMATEGVRTRGVLRYCRSNTSSRGHPEPFKRKEELVSASSAPAALTSQTRTPQTRPLPNRDES